MSTKNLNHVSKFDTATADPKLSPHRIVEMNESGYEIW